MTMALGTTQTLSEMRTKETFEREGCVVMAAGA